MDPVSAAIDPYFASTLVWEGMSLETIYGYWNPVPVMAVTVAAAALLFAVFWLMYRGKRREIGDLDRFFAFHRALLARALPPVASRFWQGVSDGARAAAGSARMIYTGNGQTYALYVVFYILAIYIASTGLGGLRVSG